MRAEVRARVQWETGSGRVMQGWQEEAGWRWSSRSEELLFWAGCLSKQLPGANHDCMTGLLPSMGCQNRHRAKLALWVLYGKELALSIQSATSCARHLALLLPQRGRLHI